MNQNRRKLIKAATLTAATALAAPAAKAATQAPKKKVHYKGGKPPERKPDAPPPLFNGAVSYGNLLFIAGKGAHYKGDIKQHTATVLDEIEKELVNAGSSMEKVLKANVYLAKAEDYQAMNEAERKALAIRMAAAKAERDAEQLRVHAAHPDGLGLPSVGDRLYGQGGDRLLLHAESL